MSRNSKLIKNTGIYFIGNFASKVLSFFLLPLYTIKLQSDDFGYVNLFVTAASFLIPIVSLQILDAAYRFMLDTKDEKDSRSIITNTLIVYLSGIVIFILIATPTVLILKIRFGIVFIVYTSIFYLFQLNQQLCRGLKKNTEYAIAGIILTFVQAISNIFFILSLDMKSVSLMVAPIVASIVCIIFLEVRVGILRKISVKLVNKSVIKNLVKYSIPLIPNTMSWWFISSFGTYFLTYYTGGTEASGILEVTNKFPTLIVMLNSIFFLAWQESAITEYNATDRDEYYSQMFNSFSKLQLSVVLVILPLIKIYIIKFIGEDFNSAWIYVPPLLLAAVFSSYSNFIGTGYMSTKKTGGAFKTTIVAAIISVIMNIILIPQIGIMGIGVSSCISYLVFWITRMFDTREFFNIQVDYKNMLKMFSLVTVMILLYYLMDIQFQIIGFIVVLIICVYINKNLVDGIIKILLKKCRLNRS